MECFSRLPGAREGFRGAQGVRRGVFLEGLLFSYGFFVLNMFSYSFHVCSYCVYMFSYGVYMVSAGFYMVPCGFLCFHIVVFNVFMMFSYVFICLFIGSPVVFIWCHRVLYVS